MKITPLDPWIGSKIGSEGRAYTRTEIEQYQLERVQRILAYVRERSRFYKRTLADFSSSPQSLREFTAYPFTTPGDLQEDPDRFLCVHPDEIHRIVTLPTSATTGPSKRIYFSQSDQELTIDFFNVGMSTLVEKGDRVMILLPGERPGSVGDLLFTGLDRLECIPYKHGPAKDERPLLEWMRGQRINAIVGAPVQLNRLAYVDHVHSILEKDQIKSVLTSTDHLPPGIISNLKRLWGCEVFDHYGTTEMGLGGGVECQAHRGYHLREADMLFEIVDPESGDPLPDGELGEVVMTTLTRTGMLLIRYRTGDLSRFLPGDCPCGTCLKTLEHIHRRKGDGCRIGSGRISQVDLDDSLFTLDGLLDFNTALESNDNGKDVLRLSLDLASGSMAGWDVRMMEALQSIPSLQEEIRSGRLGLKLEIMEREATADGNRMIKRRLIDYRATK
jgi:phenylacetate-CoA ligase